MTKSATKHKVKWRVSPAPTGFYRSFHHRGWPSAEDEMHRILFLISCADSYTPARARGEEEHGELALKIADYSGETVSFRWHTFKQRFATLKELKQFARERSEDERFRKMLWPSDFRHD